MSSNPNNAIGTNGAFGGRTSVNAFNDVMGALSRGILSGWECVPNSGLTVSLGGNGTNRDVAIAEDNAGNRTSINNISDSPINVTIGAAPGANTRIDSIVAYVDNPPTGNDTETDNPDACGLIVVEGTPASTPSPASDSTIRTAITADGASGTTAYYVVLAYIIMTSGTTDITSGEISQGEMAQIGSNIVGTASVVDDSITADKIDFGSLGSYCTASNGSFMDLPSVSITAPEDGMFIVLTSTGDTWGSGGQIMYLALQSTPTLTSLINRGPIWNGGDNVSRQGSGIALFSGANKGTSYTFTWQLTGTQGQNTSIDTLVLFVPTN